MSDSKASDADQTMKKYFFRASAADLKKISGGPIAYWLSSALGDAFLLGKKIGNSAKKGLSCSGTDLFYRNFWEVSIDRCSMKEGDVWYPITKGGPFRKWYGNNEFLINWKDSGFEIKSRVDKAGKSLAVIRNEDFYLKVGASWNDVSSGTLSCRYTPEGSIPTDSGPMIYSEEFLMEILSLLNSCVAKPFADILCPTIHFSVGQIAEFPLAVKPNMDCATRALKLINLAKNDWDAYETSWGFASFPLLGSNDCQFLLKASYQNLRIYWREVTLEMQRLEVENNKIFIDAYGLQDELTPEVPLREITLTCNPHYRYGGDKSEEELETMLLADTMRELVSYAVGCMFGRFSLDKPGLILANQGETLADYLRQVPQPSFPADDDNVIPLLDGDWFPDDITLRFRQFLRVVFGDAHYEANLAFIEQGLNVKGKRNYGLRDYFLGEFYTDHVKRYKKRPIYWLFSSPKGTFSALVYLHRYRTDTVSVVLNYLRDFRKKLASRLDYLQQVAISPSASQGDKTKANKEAETIKKQLLELDDYERDTLYPLAAKQVELDLDDGVKANYFELGAALKKIPGLEAKGED